ncbi:unnamed protein product [Trichogramma brassicae]|uniref:DUF5641 domain-containing protein n=1 Tax=Trichogramma brassicae TaxID=86971 RepID=A0A6H5IXI6_9HYME|nr:unnamed protein product [Trichogramma brassicae]
MPASTSHAAASAQCFDECTGLAASADCGAEFSVSRELTSVTACAADAPARATILLGDRACKSYRPDRKRLRSNPDLKYSIGRKRKLCFRGNQYKQAPSTDRVINARQRSAAESNNPRLKAASRRKILPLSDEQSQAGSAQFRLVWYLSPLNESIRRFWHIEEISSKPLLTPEEDECEKHFASTHERDAAGRYVIRLPLKRELSSTSVDLGDSRAAAKRSLYHMERRFRRDDALHAAYADFMAEYQSMNHMELVSEEELPKNAVYLPHHGVWKEGKLRVVFNASCVTSKGLSLNSLLHTGANLLPDLSHLLLRWRTYKYVFSTDIQKMFRQILVHENDRHLQCILWRKHDTEPIATYRLTTVTYGMGSAPFLAIRSLRQLARDEGEEYPLAASVLQQEVYMDDGLSGGHSVKEAREKRDQLIRMLRVGGFKLHKWAANDEALIDDIPADQRASTVARSFDVAEAVGVLGLMWSPTEDSFLYKLQLDRIEGAITKRKILSKIAQVFDPLGWISPVTIVGKLLIQQLWLKGIDWDVELPEDLRSFWTMWYSSLEGLAKVRIDRWTGYVPDAARIELHGFADASLRAYAAVIYLRIVTATSIKVVLLQAKSKVAPTNTLSVPRLELCGALLLARLMQSVMSELHIEPDKINLWTDSTDVIYWLQAHPSRWQTFVANRCSTIHTLLPDVGWHHVRSADNPADILSRGTTVEELLTSDLWWRGPPWLSLDTAEWPPVALSLPPRVREERKAAAVVLANNERDQEDPGVAGKFSSMLRLLRGTVICFRFLRACVLVRVRRRSEVLDWIRRMPLERSSSLSTEEMCHVRMFWISWAQRREFAAERRAVGDNVSVRPSSRLASLHPIFVEGILRVGGRLKHSLLDFDEAHPIILPSDSPITALLIREAHETTLHGGVQLTLATLRRRYWILRGRQVVKGFIRGCTTCVRQAAAAVSPRMGDLPMERVRVALPFSKVGVDYAGPFHVRAFHGRGRTSVKSYIAVFVCFVTKAVHLELVFKCDAPSFIAALKRFISRRGYPAEIWSDCGTNFVGADAELRAMFAQESELVKGSGRRGQADERGVRDAVVSGGGLFDSRPLTSLVDDSQDAQPLTPAHFLIGRASIIIAEPRLTEDCLSPCQRWQLVTQMVQHFWDRWSEEYIRQLQPRGKWRKDTPAPKVGDVVLIKYESTPPTAWPLARVTEVHPGKDGVVRVLTLKTATSTVRRPVVKRRSIDIESAASEKSRCCRCCWPSGRSPRHPLRCTSCCHPCTWSWTNCQPCIRLQPPSGIVSAHGYI